MKRRILFIAALFAAYSLHAEPISRATILCVFGIARSYGVPESVTYQQQIEESGDRHTGQWGDAKAVSKKKSRGFHSRGLFQIWEEPAHLAYLIAHYWPRHLGTFDIEDPIDNTVLAMSYLSALHDRFGNWYEALVFYNSGKLLKDAPQESKDYARRIVRAAYPVLLRESSFDYLPEAFQGQARAVWLMDMENGQ